MSLARDFLYELLPAFVRNRDFYQGQPLRALMEVLEIEYRQLWEAAEAQYEDWFIETCRPETVAAIADLLAITSIGMAPRQAGGRQRALVANTIRYRRRKGVPSALEQALADATGWTVRVRPLSAELVAAANLRDQESEMGRSRLGRRHELFADRRPEPIQPVALGTLDLRNELALASLGTPFERVPRVNAVRRLGGEPGDVLTESSGAGSNLTDLGITIWRLGVYPLTKVDAARQAPGCYCFHPLGVDTPLFNRPQQPLHAEDAMDPRQVPEPFSRERLGERLDRLSVEQAALLERLPGWSEGDVAGWQPVLSVYDPQTGRPLPATALGVADLSSWKRTPPVSATSADGSTIRMWVDPELGRLAFPEGSEDPGHLQVSFHYGFAADLGGGPYLRIATPDSVARVDVSSGDGVDGSSAGELWTTEPLPVTELGRALEAWRASGQRRGLIRLVSSFLAPGNVGQTLRVDLSSGRELSLEMAASSHVVLPMDLIARAEEGTRRAKLRLSGLWLQGRVELSGNVELMLAHSTLSPPGVLKVGGATKLRTPSLILSGNSERRIVLEHSIAGPIYHREGLSEIEIRDSILDGGSHLAVGAAPTHGGSRLVLDLARVTVLGAVRCAELRLAESVLFAGRVEVDDTSTGVVRYSYVPAGSRTPPRLRCAPAEPPPVFTSKRYGAAGYAQLANSSPRAIRAGTEHGAEIGAFAQLHQTQREAALAAVLAEYLPVGLVPRVVYVT